jgi:hypothetical protein
MTETTNEICCLNCGRSEKDVPLLTIRYDGREGWVCAGCMPVLIHKTEQLVAKLQRNG